MHEITTLPNGIKIITQSMPSTQSVTVNFFIGAGGRYENIKTEYGVSHFLEHLLFKGTHQRPTARQISEEVDAVGGIVNAYTSEDHTSFYIKLPKAYFGLAFNILADMLTDPLFDSQEIDKERNVVIEEMNVYRDDPARYVTDFVGDLLWPQDNLKTNVIGSEQIISTIPRDSIVAYYKSLYTADNMVISVAGNISHKQVVDMAHELLGGLHTQATRKWQPVTGGIAKQKVNHHFEETNQTHMMVAGRAPQVDAPDEPAMMVLSTLLGRGMSSRLWLRVREEKGLAYTVDMSYHNFLDSGKYEIYAGVNTDKVNDALTAICTELQQIQRVPVSSHELSKAKEQVRGRLIMGLESNAAVADKLGSEAILTGKAESLSEMLTRVDSVTPESIQHTAQEYLYKDNLRLAIIGPFRDEHIKQFEEIMENTK